MNTESGADAPAEVPADIQQPQLEIVRDDVHYTLLGTAHVSRASVEAVEKLLAEHRYDAVAVELCESRFQSIRDPDSLAKLDLIRVIREGKVGLVGVNLALAGYQRRLAEQLGVEPGAEMRAAIEGGEASATPVWRVDRDVSITLRRVRAALGFWDRMMVMSGLFASLFVDDKVDEEEIERLKQGDMLESTFSEFARKRENLYRALIAERDEFMAGSLRQHALEQRPRKVLVVIGAGHLAGLARHLQQDEDAPVLIQQTLERGSSEQAMGTWLTIALAVLVVGGFIYGFSQGTEIGLAVVARWVLVTGTLGAIGCALAGGHPLSILGAFVASPLTPLHPALASGTVSALIELWLRRPTVADFSSLREDSSTWRGWWRNRVARVILNFFLTSAGTAIGVYIAGWSMISKLF